MSRFHRTTAPLNGRRLAALAGCSAKSRRYVSLGDAILRVDALPVGDPTTSTMEVGYRKGCLPISYPQPVSRASIHRRARSCPAVATLRPANARPLSVLTVSNARSPSKSPAPSIIVRSRTHLRAGSVARKLSSAVGQLPPQQLDDPLPPQHPPAAPEPPQHSPPDVALDGPPPQHEPPEPPSPQHPEELAVDASGRGGPSRNPPADRIVRSPLSTPADRFLVALFRFILLSSLFSLGGFTGPPDHLGSPVDSRPTCPGALSGRAPPAPRDACGDSPWGGAPRAPPGVRRRRVPFHAVAGPG